MWDGGVIVASCLLYFQPEFTLLTMKSFYQLHHEPKGKKGHSVDSDEKLAWWWAIPIVLAISLIIGLTFIAFYKLPDPINDRSRNGSFIASRAKEDLQEFVDIGPKVVGSAANEQTTVQYLMKRLAQIEADSNGLYDIEIDLQKASGGFVREKFINIYDNIQNVIVKITPKGTKYTKSVLVNSHFDTVSDSPGAGDDGSMVVAMLEVLRILTNAPSVVRHPIVFLFNGAEENGLQGSHAFITQHKWASDVAAFLNLDATGTGGKEILFQTGPNSPWLVDCYANGAKFPYASVIGEEIFERDIIPSDTDFRIFRDYGKIPGLDLAYAYNDYVYHTRYDDIDMIEDGTYQHTGDNVLGIVRAMANADEIEEKSGERSEGKAVFFDVFGLFLVNYSETTGIIVNMIISVAALVTIALSVWLMQRTAAISAPEILIQFGISFCIQLGSLVISIGVVIFMAFFVDIIGYSLSWFSQPWMIFGLYFIPFIFIMAIFPALFMGGKRFNSLPIRFRITLFLHSHCIMLILVIVVLTGLSFRTAFFVSQCVLFYTLAQMLNLITKWYLRPHLWIVPILIGQVIPISFIAYIMEITFSLFIPINGRSGAANNPEMMISLFAIVYSVLIFGFIIPIFSIFHKAKTMLLALVVAFIIFFILMFTSVCFPYRAKTSAQRQAILHTKRVMYDANGNVRNEDAGFYAITWDRQAENTVQDIIDRLKLPQRDASKDCGTELFCGLPIYHPMMLTSLSTGLWIDAVPPKINSLSSIKLVSKTNISGNIYRYTFELAGTKQNEILVKGLSDAKVGGWSFTTSDTPSFDTDEYFIHSRFGVVHETKTFSLDMKVVNASAPAVMVGLIAHYAQGDVDRPQELVDFSKEFPDWTHLQIAEATYQSWQF